jgi:ATP-dependent protease ClpP protease subunit
LNQFYNIRAAATEGAPNEVYIYDEIGFWGTTAQTFHNAIQALSGKIVVRINSPGGNVFDSIAIHSMLSRLPDVETVTDGLAASAASVIFAAGKVRKMAKAAFVMIHNPWAYAQGSADDMRKEADILDGITTALVKLYKGASSKSEDELREMMDDETWMDGDAALAAGFATEVFDAPVAKASISEGRYKRTPTAFACMKHVEKPKDSMSNKLLALLGVSGTRREEFLASAVTSLGVANAAIEAAEKDNKADFIATHIEARIKQADDARATAEAQAKEANDKLAAFVAAAGIDAKATDYKAAIAAAIKTAASKEAAEILAAQGQTKPVDDHKQASTDGGKSELTGVDRVVAALRAAKN